MMSVEEQLSNAVQACNNLTASINGKVVQIDQKVDAAVKAIPELHKVFYVDAEAGVDTNVGTTSVTALKTIREAVNRTPQNGSVQINLKRNQDHFMTGDAKVFIDCDNKTITINAYSSGSSPVIKMMTGTESNGVSLCYGFRVPTYARITVINCVIDTMSLHPDTPGNWSDYGGFASRSYQEGQVGTILMTLSSCKIKLRDHQLTSHYNRVEYSFRDVEVEHVGTRLSLVGVAAGSVSGNTYYISASTLTLTDGAKTLSDLFSGITAQNSLTNLSLA